MNAAPVTEMAHRHRVVILHGRLVPERNSLDALGRHKVLAFAGIGNPEKFFLTLTDAGIDVAERASFPDHHRYTAKEAKDLLARADAGSLVLITTEKDHVRRGRRSAPCRARRPRQHAAGAARDPGS